MLQAQFAVLFSVSGGGGYNSQVSVRFNSFHYRHIFINPHTGLEYDTRTFGRAVMDNPSAPIMTNDSGLLTVNNTHIQVFNVLYNTSMVKQLPEPLPYGALRYVKQAMSLFQ